MKNIFKGFASQVFITIGVIVFLLAAVSSISLINKNFESNTEAAVLKSIDTIQTSKQDTLLQKDPVTRITIPYNESDYRPINLPRSRPRIILTGGGIDLEASIQKNNVIAYQNPGWQEILEHAPWQARTYHSSFVFNNQIWVLGGLNFDVTVSPWIYEEFNDVWSSKNGKDWEKVAQNTPWHKRLSQTSLVFNDKIFLMGGSSFQRPAGPRTYFNDVWSSKDGKDWDRVIENAAWSGRQGHTSLVFNNKLWVLGGTGQSNSLLDDVWSSIDGKVWVRQLQHAPWEQRTQHTSVVFNGRMWVMGGVIINAQNPFGLFRNDVWSSSDGINWTQATANAGWAPRVDARSFVFGNKIWIVGGDNYSPGVEAVYTDAWSSSDGINWTQETSEIPDLYGQGFGAVAF